MRKLKNRTGIRRLILPGLFSILVAGLGTYYIFSSHAATFATSQQAANGTIAGNAATVSDTNASGGKAVRFGSGASSQMCTNPIWSSSSPTGTWNTNGY